MLGDGRDKRNDLPGEFQPGYGGIWDRPYKDIPPLIPPSQPPARRPIGRDEFLDEDTVHNLL